MAPRKRNPNSDHQGGNYDGTIRRRQTGGNGGPWDYTGREEDMVLPKSGANEDVPKPSLEHVQVKWGTASRKSRLNPDNVHQMQLLVAAGTPIPTACTAIGAGQAWKRWNTDARDHERLGIQPGWDEDCSPELFWLYAMEQAKAAFETSMVARVGAAAVTDWRAAAWLLERRASQRWYPRSKLEIHANGEKRAEISAMSMSKLIDIARGVIPDTSDIKVLQSGDDPGHSGGQREIIEAEIDEG
jgi:transposase